MSTNSAQRMGAGAGRFQVGTRPTERQGGGSAPGLPLHVAVGKAQPSEPISALLRPPEAPSHAGTTPSPLHAHTTVNNLAAGLPLPRGGRPRSVSHRALGSASCCPHTGLLLLLEHSKGVPPQRLAFHLSGRT